MKTNPSTTGDDLSIILPVFNEEGNLAQLVEELHTATAQIGMNAEIIVVDDASTDGSARIARELAARFPKVKYLLHVRNFGQSAAFASGIAQAKSSLIVTLDADGQHDPVDLPALVAALQPHQDAVCGFRKHRHDTRIRRFSSIIANGFRNTITGDRITDAGCTFRIIRRAALAEIPIFNGTHRFLPTLLRFQGYAVTEVPVNHRPRAWGVSKYGIRNRLFRGIVDCFAIRWWKRRALSGRRINHGSESC